ncbi:MAG: aa3-type cytochrome c oxidase subunit IV [Sphingomicrobium sp.]
MADHAPQPTTIHEYTPHAEGYTRFMSMMKWGTIVSVLIGAVVVLFVL